MTDSAENLILEHLWAIRARVEQHSEDFAGLKLRISSIETQLGNVHTDLAILHNRIDSVERRLDRIEKRLELTSV